MAKGGQHRASGGDKSPRVRKSDKNIPTFKGTAPAPQGSQKGGAHKGGSPKWWEKLLGL